MGKINKKILIFVVFLIFTILLGPFVKTSINMLIQLMNYKLVVY